MRHFFIAGLIVIGLTILGLLGLQRVTLLPSQASWQAALVDWLFNIHFVAIVVLFSLIVGLMIYSVIVFRRRKGDLTDGPHIEGSNRLEVIWTTIPLIAVLVLAYVSSFVLRDVEKADAFPVEINVIGSQWAWRFEYPQQGVTSTELRMPVDKQSWLHIASTDVIHSFWVPEFRIKQDALPGGDAFVRNLRITPSKTGEYRLRCAEMCGLDHAGMEAPVIVMPEAEFNAWIESQASAEPTPAPSDPAVASGQQLYQEFTCNACHSIDGSPSVGPTWEGLFGSQVPLTDGTTVTAEHDYLVESIRDPEVKIHEGFPNAMPPTIADPMTDEQIEDVIAFIESLK